MLWRQHAVRPLDGCRCQLSVRFFRKAAYLSQRRVLLCGDGDLSYGASLAKNLSHQGTHLTATVLEPQEEHHRVYRQSMVHVQQIQEYGHSVRFGIDATRLETHAELAGPYDLIQFNFPHWRGKANTRKNRTLVNDFFASSRKVLTRDGHVHLALFDHQGGAHSTTLREWKHSWMPARLAADHNLLLIRVEPFEPTYQLSSYRGEDREFGMREGEPRVYIFAAPDASDCHAELDVQLFCHFNVHLRQDYCASSEETSLTRLQHLVQEQLLPHGWRAQVSFVRRTRRGEGEANTDYFVSTYKVCFFGETRPILQSEADCHRTICLNAMIADNIPLVMRRNWVISNVYPSSMLCGIMHADQTRQHGDQ